MAVEGLQPKDVGRLQLVPEAPDFLPLAVELRSMRVAIRLPRPLAVVLSDELIESFAAEGGGGIIGKRRAQKSLG